MALSLIVSEPFGDYKRGDEITDPAIIQAVRSGENAARVVVVSDEVVPPPPTEPATSPLQGIQAEILLLNQRIAILEARPAGTDTTPPPAAGQLAGAALVDRDGSKIYDGDGDLLVR